MNNIKLSSNCVVDFKSQYEGLWTGIADANSNISQGTVSIDPQWHSGGIVPPDYKPNTVINIPTRYVEIDCLYCNTRFSTTVVQNRCWSVHCMSCQKWFKLHMGVCDPDCDQRVECLLMGIMTHVGRRTIIDITGVRMHEKGEWIANPHATVNVTYDIPSQLYVIKYESQYYESRVVQDNRFEGDPFQLPDVSKR